jgi:inhibitor of KinA
MNLEPLGDTAVVATLGRGIDERTLASVLGLADALAPARGRGIVDIVPAYATVTAFYDASQFPAADGDAYGQVCRFIESCAAGAGSRPAPARERTVEIPVCYGGEFGPDLAGVARRAGLPPDEAAALHAAGAYRVHAIGFMPGFPYLGGLPAALHSPRRPSPRPRVPAGSVGIGGGQTGVYPVSSPGGWQLIGRTPLRLFQPEAEPPAMLRPGDRVRFRAITEEAFRSWS